MKREKDPRRELRRRVLSERSRQEFLVLVGRTVSAAAKAKLSLLEKRLAAMPSNLTIEHPAGPSSFETMMTADSPAPETMISSEHAPDVSVGSRLRRAQALIAKHHERAIMFGVPSSLTETQWLLICDSQEEKCIYCDCSSWLTVEHIIPVSQGGPNASENVVGICLQCNLSKGARNLVYWLDSKGIDVDMVMLRIARSRDRQ